MANLGRNPFLNTLQIPVTLKVHKVINKYGDNDVKEFEFEKTPYTKVFEIAGAKKLVNAFPVRAKELYLYIIQSIESAQDYLWIDRHAYMKLMDIKSVNTYKQAVSHLWLTNFIYPHGSIQDVFWINPQFFFKGSRINKFKNNVIVEK